MTLEYIMDHWNCIVTPIFKKVQKKWSDPCFGGGLKKTPTFEAFRSPNQKKRIVSHHLGVDSIIQSETPCIICSVSEFRLQKLECNKSYLSIACFLHSNQWVWLFRNKIDALKKLAIPQHANIILFTLLIILKSVEIALHNPIETFKLSCNFGTNLTLYVYF